MRFETLGTFVRQHHEMEQDVYAVTRKMNLHLEQCIRENPTAMGLVPPPLETSSF